MGYDFKSLTRQADEASNRNKFYTDFEDVDPSILHQISDLTEWLRTKAKGSDVREVIAQLFERTWLEGTKKGNANMEVALARGTSTTLSDRLNQIVDASKEIDKKTNVASNQINNLIAHAGNGTVPSELTDIRVGYDGKTHSTAGEAIREQFNLFEAFNKNLSNGLIVNVNNIFPDYKLETAVPLDSSTTILNEDDEVSKIIKISNTTGKTQGAKIPVNNLFKDETGHPKKGKYFIHLKAKVTRNAQYAYQTPSIFLYQYDGLNLKGNLTKVLTSPKAIASENQYIDYVVELNLTGTEAGWNTFHLLTTAKFDYYIKDFYIVKDIDTTSNLFNELVFKDSIEDLIKPHIEKAIQKNNADLPEKSLKIGVIGDSISDSEMQFPEKWHTFLKSNDGYKINQVAVSGSGYFNGSNKNGTNNHQFHNQALLLDEDCDIVVVFGGFNDATQIVNKAVTLGSKKDNGTNTIAGLINKTIDNILEHLPLVKICIASPTPWQGMNPMISESNQYHDAVIGIVDMIRDICEYRGIPYLDLFRSSGLRPWNERFREEYYVSLEDGTHPNKKGQEQFIYPKMREFLKSLI